MNGFRLGVRLGPLATRSQRASRTLSPGWFALAAGLCSVLGSEHFWPLVCLSPGLLLLAIKRATFIQALWAGFIFGATEALQGWGAASYGLAVPVLIQFFNGCDRLLLCAGIFWLLPDKSGRRAPATFTWLLIGGWVFLWEHAAPILFGRFEVSIGLGIELGGSSLALAIVAAVGTAGLSALLFVVASQLLFLPRPLLDRLVLAAASVALLAGAGFARAQDRVQDRAQDRVQDDARRGERASIKVWVAQGQVPNWAYASSFWVPAIEREIEKRYLEALFKAPPADLWVLPETAIRPHARRVKGILQDLQYLAKTKKTAIVVGMPAGSGAAQQNLAFSISAEGEVVGRSIKSNLIPYVERELKSGQFEQGTVTLAGRRVGVLICSESLYPTRARLLVDGGADLLLIIANDAGFAASELSAMHARRGALLAAEFGVEVIHVGQAHAVAAFDVAGRRLVQTPAGGGYTFLLGAPAAHD